MSRIRVLLADDLEVFVRVVARLLESEFEVVKTVRDGQALVDEATRLDPDVLIVDISMPVLNGIEAVQQLHSAGSRAKIVFLTVHEDAHYVRAALAAGGRGYVLKSRLGIDLLPAIKEVLAGQIFISPTTALKIKATVPGDLASPIG